MIVYCQQGARGSPSEENKPRLESERRGNDRALTLPCNQRQSDSLTLQLLLVVV